MGANQSSKSVQIASGFNEQHQKSASKGFSESLRKKLNSSRSISKSTLSEKQKQRLSCVENGSLMDQQQQVDQYYVSGRPTGKFVSANNNYVSMQMAAECAKQMDFVGCKSVDRLEMNSVRDGSFISLQDKQNKSSVCSTENNNSKQGRRALLLHPQPKSESGSSTPFHLSRAVNTKTSSVLNNNNAVAVAMPNCHSMVANGRQQEQPNNGSLQNPFNQYNQHPYNQHQIYASPSSTTEFDAENEQYLRKLLLDNELQQQQQRRYKCPQQQYQYLNLRANAEKKEDLVRANQIQRAYNRSYSFGSSLTLESNKKKKAKNALISIFQNNSNTIHLSRQSRDNQRSCPGSLKRLSRPIGPLSAQQASYEAMRTIDMYLVRQIARSCMDFEMEQKIELEIRLRELAAQSMMEAQSEIDVLEVEKSLLTSDQRMSCYASLLEEQRKQLSNPSLSTDSGRGSKSGNRLRSDVIGACDATSSPSFSSLSNSQSPSKLSPVSGKSANSPSSMSSHISRTGHRSRSSSTTNTLSAKQKAKNKRREQLVQSITNLSNINCNMVVNNHASVSLSEIRIPLMWRDVDHFKGRGDYKRYAVFCLLKIDSQIYDTQLISDVDRQVTDVTFEDVVVFNGIDHNFELNFEVYSCVYYEQFSFSSTPRKLKEKLTSSVSRAMGRRLATQTASVNYTKELQAYDKSYRFAMIANATMRLSDASDSVKTYDLVLSSPSAHHRQHYHNSNLDTLNNSYSQSSATTTTSTTSNTKDASKNTLPLFGHFCCKLQVRPDVFDKIIKTGYLRVSTINVPSMNHQSDYSLTGRDSERSMDRQSLVGLNRSESSSRSAWAASSKMATLSMSNSSVHWGLLRNFTLHLWPVDERKLNLAIMRGELPHLDNPSRRPSLSLNIDKYSRLLRVSNTSLTLESDKGCFVLGSHYIEAGLVQQTDEISHWLRAIEQLIYDSHIWGSVLNHYPPHTRHSNNTSPRSSDGRVLSRLNSNSTSKQQHESGAMLQADL